MVRPVMVWLGAAEPNTTGVWAVVPLNGGAVEAVMGVAPVGAGGVQDRATGELPGWPATGGGGTGPSRYPPSAVLARRG